VCQRQEKFTVSSHDIVHIANVETRVRHHTAALLLASSPEVQCAAFLKDVFDVVKLQMQRKIFGIRGVKALESHSHGPVAVPICRGKDVSEPLSTGD
jgi:hypothetical protein